MSSGTFIVITCFNENKAIIQLLSEMEDVLKNVSETFTVVVVDDASTDGTIDLVKAFQFKEKNLTLKLLELDFNVGHQKAIAQGLHYIQSRNAEFAIVMDGDGEDDPSAIPELLKLRQYDIVHVQRGKRGENLSFRISYRIYRFLFRFLTKKKMNFGNYCMINSKVIHIINYGSFTHFAAFLSKQKLKSSSIISDRRKRFSGKSKMNMNGLIYHAFRSFVEYAEEMLMVFLRLSVILFSLFVLSIVYVVYEKLFTTKAILGWASTLGIGLLTLSLLCIGFFIIGILLLNMSRNRQPQKIVPIYKEV